MCVRDSYVYQISVLCFLLLMRVMSGLVAGIVLVVISVFWVLSIACYMANLHSVFHDLWTLLQEVIS